MENCKYLVILDTHIDPWCTDHLTPLSLETILLHPDSFWFYVYFVWYKYILSSLFFQFEWSIFLYQFISRLCVFTVEVCLL